MTVHGYLERLNQLTREVKATVAGGEAVDVDQAMERFVAMMAALPAQGGKAMFIGNGGSAAIASHFATDFTKNGGVPTLVFSDAALLTCVGNDLGYENVYAKPVEMFAKAGDLLLAISSSGRSENILRAVHSARRLGLGVVTMSGFSPDNPLRSLGDVNFHVASPSYGFVECSHFVLCHIAIDSLMRVWPPVADGEVPD